MRIKLIILFSLFSYFSSAQIIATGVKGMFKPTAESYTLSTESRVSAGVYKNDGSDDILIRTLFNGVSKPAGTYSVPYWDGFDDSSRQVANDEYKIKVVVNNVTYEWIGVVGNNSKYSSGAKVHHPFQMAGSMAQFGNFMYYTVGYNETGEVHSKFNIDSPDIKMSKLRGGGLVARYVVADGQRVYYAGFFGTKFGVTAIVPHGGDSSETMYTFSSGVTIPYLAYTYSVIDTGSWEFVRGPDGQLPIEYANGPYGLAIQKTGNYLFVAHMTVDSLVVLNKNSGAFVRRILADSVREVTAQGEGFLWMITGNNTVAKYPINSDGNLGTATITLSGITNPLSLSISPDSSKIAVCDRGTYNQVKIFNTSTGNLIITLGRAENYSNPTVYNDKFYFNNTRVFTDFDIGSAHSFSCFQSDGSLWVGDYGNMRVQHFASNFSTFLNTMQYMGYSYSSQADYNNPTRVFSDFLEFKINYSDNSWQFVRNWSKNITIPTYFDSDRMRSVATLSNGRTYALYFDGDREVIELDTTTGIRHTGVYLDNDHNSDLNPDGSQWEIGGNIVGVATFWKKRLLTGFTSNNPVWGTQTTVTTTPAVQKFDPFTTDGYLHRMSQTTSGNIITYNTDKPASDTVRGAGWHLGGLKNGKWIFKTALSTHKSYQGIFPPDGAFDIGNGINNAASYSQVIGNNIFAQFHGENWKGTQTNKYNHWTDDGLFIGQMGVTGDDARSAAEPEAYPGFAGNALSGTFVKIGSDIHLFHADEGGHGAVHHWKISNLASIQRFSFNITKSGTPAPPILDYVDLMAGIPRDSILLSNTAGWTRNPTSEVGAEEWHVRTGLTTYRKDESDIYIKSYPATSGLTRTVQRDLGTNSLSAWKITGEVAFLEPGEPNYNNLEVLDANGRVIVKLNKTDTFPNVTIKANNTILFQGGDGYYRFKDLHALSFSKSGSSITVSFAGLTPVVLPVFDNLADITNPKTLRVQMYSAGTAGHQIDIANFRFYDHL